MKKLSRTLMFLVLCLVVALGMCTAFTSTADAATMQVKDGDTIYLTDINGANSNVTMYQSEALSKRTTPLTYNLKLPTNGGTVFTLIQEDYVSVVKVNGGASSDWMNIDSNRMRVFSVSGNTAKLQVTPKRSTTSFTFGVWYAPKSKTITTGKEFVIGATGTNAVSSFTVTAPSKGYFDVSVAGDLDASSSANVRAAGFKGWEYLSSYSNNSTTRIGVKKGKYTIQVKSYSTVRNVKVTFHKVKETSSKTTKKKAAKIKKKKINKAIVVTNSKKVHWYKIKNPKKQKMRLTVNASKMGYGSSSTGKLKVTVYFPDNNRKSYFVYAGSTRKQPISYGYIGARTALKGTYYVKVQSLSGANGYYTLKWW